MDHSEQLPLAASLRGTILRTAGVGISGGGTTIAGLIHRARAPNTWKNNEPFWQKWTTFSEVEGIDPWAANEGSLLRYLDWLFDSGTIAGGSVKNYISAVVTAHKRIKMPVEYTALIQLALAAYQKSDLDRRAAADLEAHRERRALPTTVARKIFDTAMAAPSLNRQFIRNATAVLVSYVFFERGEAGAALRMDNIQVSAKSIDLAIALRKNRSRVAHTLSYARLSPDKPSLINLVLRYDRYRKSARSTSR